MCWGVWTEREFADGRSSVGGSTTSAVLMRTTPGFLASPLLLPFYAALYTLFSLARVPQVISALIPSFLLDIALASLDAVNRTLTVTSVLSLLASHPDPALHHNAYAACVLSAIAVSFGGILASALGVWEAEWRVQTPRILKPGAGILGTLDVWSGALVAAVYMVLVNWEGVRPYRASNLAVALRDAAGSLGGKTLGDGEGAAMTALHARTACTLLMGGLLVGRVLILYGQAWWAVVRRAVPRDDTKKAKTAAAAGRADSAERAASATSEKSSVAHSTGVEPALGESPKKRKGAKGAVSKGAKWVEL